jgi:DNA-binding HxlR family transcriptional regulator
VESAGLIKSNPGNKPRILYSLTEKGGDLVYVLVEIVLWSAKHDKKTAAPEEFIARLKNDRKNLVEEIYLSHRQSKQAQKKGLR